MTEPRFHVAAIGNAIVDILVHADDSMLADLGVDKGVMTLIDAERAEEIYHRLPPGMECSGGSAANTAAGVAALGSRAAYLGKIRKDELGTVFSHDIRNSGVTFTMPMAEDGPSTARCFVLVTPDAQRTMQTYLGACVNLCPEDIDHQIIADSAITYLEGYLFDPDLAKQAFYVAAEVAHRAGRKVALSLSDPFCVKRHHAAFVEFVNNHVDILFANEDELLALTECEHFGDALKSIKSRCELAVITRGARGAIAVTKHSSHAVGIDPSVTVVDTTGAGDLFAAGVLHGLAQGENLTSCVVLGTLAAGEIISHFGARPAQPLKTYVEQRLHR